MVRWEYELIPILARAKDLVSGGANIAQEVSSGYGIADLVFYDFDQKIVSERSTQGLNPIDESNVLQILVELKQYSTNESFSITTLRKKVSHFDNKMMTYLVDNEFIIPNTTTGKSVTYRKGRDYKNGLKDVVAIEAKLRDWKGGLYQAYRYRRYADKSYLAVYSKSIAPPLKNIGEFEKYNVGLIEVKDDDIVVHHHPQKESCSDSFMKAVAYENLLASQHHILPGSKKVARTVTV